VRSSRARPPDVQGTGPNIRLTGQRGLCKLRPCLASRAAQWQSPDRSGLSGGFLADSFGFQSSSMVEQPAVNRRVAGSSPASGAILREGRACFGYIFCKTLRAASTLARPRISETGWPPTTAPISAGGNSRVRMGRGHWFGAKNTQREPQRWPESGRSRT
jgi:hypothetical protein